jgi:hypothetical protein
MGTSYNLKTGEVVHHGEPDFPPSPQSVLVFDDRLTSTAAAYTSADFVYLLGAYSRMRIQALASNVSGTAPTLTVQLEHSADERNFVSVNTTPEINASALAVGAVTNVVSVGTLGTRAQHHAARLRVQLGGTSPQADLKIWVTMRGKV